MPTHLSIRVRYRFSAAVDMTQVMDTYRLALLAGEGAFGTARMEIGVVMREHLEKRYCDVEAEPDIGRMLHGVFLTYLRANLGQDAVRVSWLRRRAGNGGES